MLHTWHAALPAPLSSPKCSPLFQNLFLLIAIPRTAKGFIASRNLSPDAKRHAALLAYYTPGMLKFTFAFCMSFWMTGICIYNDTVNWTGVRTGARTGTYIVRSFGRTYGPAKVWTGPFMWPGTFRHLDRPA